MVNFQATNHKSHKDETSFHNVSLRPLPRLILVAYFNALFFAHKSKLKKIRNFISGDN